MYYEDKYREAKAELDAAERALNRLTAYADDKEARIAELEAAIGSLLKAESIEDERGAIAALCKLVT